MTLFHAVGVAFAFCGLYLTKVTFRRTRSPVSPNAAAGQYNRLKSMYAQLR